MLFCSVLKKKAIFQENEKKKEGEKHFLLQIYSEL